MQPLLQSYLIVVGFQSVYKIFLFRNVNEEMFPSRVPNCICWIVCGVRALYINYIHTSESFISISASDYAGILRLFPPTA